MHFAIPNFLSETPNLSGHHSNTWSAGSCLYFILPSFLTKRFDSCICPSLYIQREKVRNPVNNLINGTIEFKYKKIHALYIV